MVKIGAWPAWGLLGTLLGTAYADITLQPDDPASVRAAAKAAVANMLRFYHGNETGRIPGLVDAPYYWWEGGAMFGQLINYWHLTKDSTYNQLITDGILHQIGDDKNFEPYNWTQQLGNDDQQFWAFTAMDAAESGFPNPPPDQPGWLALAQAVFHRQINRWETQDCGGGIRWQTQVTNKGWNYKNTPSNAGLFHLSARLARYTNNATYAEWAEKVWDWTVGMGYVAKADDGALIVNDGAHIENQCKDIVPIRWTYNYGTVLNGLSYMYNYTNGGQKWKDNIDALLLGARILFVAPNDGGDDPQIAGTGNILAEIACELQTVQTCNVDNPAFKAFTLRWMASATQLVPDTAPALLPLIRASAERLPAICKGSIAPPEMDTKQFCGRRWYWGGKMDGNFGFGEQMSALSAFQNLLVSSSAPPLTAANGGSSQGDVTAGLGQAPLGVDKPVTSADKGGAGFLTFLVLLAQLAGAWWIMLAKD